MLPSRQARGDDVLKPSQLCVSRQRPALQKLSRAIGAGDHSEAFNHQIDSKMLSVPSGAI